MSRFFRYKVHHILFWLLYFVFWTYFSMHTYDTEMGKAILATSFYFLAQAGMGYFSIYYLMPRFFYAKRYLSFTIFVFLGILAGAFIITAGMYTIFYSMLMETSSPITPGTYYLYSLIPVLSSTLLFVSVRVIRDRVQAQKMNSLLEKEKTENELKFLKAQTNPHFLFNAINSVYVLIKKDPDLAQATLARFSDMLRYQLYECNFAEVPIEKEMDYLHNYIELEKLRKGEGMSIEYQTNDLVSSFLISPLLIIPFVENAFKHVSNFPDRKNFVRILTCYENGLFTLTVRNSIDQYGVWQSDYVAGGIGQDNTKRRLKLIYPDRHELRIGKADGVYEVSLTIKII